MPTDLILLANSKKLGNRCLAGVTFDGMWVRPVPDRQGSGVSASVSSPGGLALMPRNLISLELLEACPLIFQEENVLFDTDSLSLVEPSPAIDLEDLAHAPLPYFLEVPGDAVLCSSLEAETAPLPSLALVDPEQLSITRTGHDKGKASFTLGDIDFYLPVSDDVFVSSMNADFVRSDDYYLCISLGVPFSPHGWPERHYKLVAGVVPK